MPGLEFEREQKTIYTYDNLLSHVVGYVGRDIGRASCYGEVF